MNNLNDVIKNAQSIIDGFQQKRTFFNDIEYVDMYDFYKTRGQESLISYSEYLEQEFINILKQLLILSK